MRVRTIRYSPGGPSAPQGRTVRSYVFHTTRDEHRLWYNFEISQRTVRAPRADRLPFILEIHQRQQCLWYKLSNSRRTVRAPGADRPRPRSTAQPEKHALWYKLS